MSKRIVALLLCLLMCVSVLVGCTPRIKFDSDIKGAYITMYLTDEVYNFDPAYAYMNEEAESIVSLMFSRLFTLNSNGKIQKDLAKEYEYSENEKTKEYTLTITLRDAWWSDKIKLTADDVVFAWKRILSAENSFACASLLFDVKNARAAKAGNCSIDDLGVCALNDNTVEITFEKPIDYEQFLINLTSLALAPLREDYVTKGDDWAKRSSTMVSSGPFKLSKIKYSDNSNTRYTDINGDELDPTGVPAPYQEPKNLSEATFDLLVLERNAYYDRDPSEDKLDLNEAVEPFRIIVSYIKSDEELLAAFRGQSSVEYFLREADGSISKDKETGEPIRGSVRDNIFYMGAIPLSLRNDESLMKNADITNALSTMSFYLNQDALIDGDALFAVKEVRQALSLALNRASIAQALVLADPATGLIPSGIFDKGNKGDFRKEVGDLLATSDEMAKAQEILATAKIDDKVIKPSNYSFSITVNANDDGQLYLAEAAVEAWTQLGFKVELNKRGTIRNNDYYEPTASIPDDLCDDLYTEDLLNRNYEVAIVDYCAYSADAYSMLAPLAADFSGMIDAANGYEMVPHLTGYNSERYNLLIEAIYYLPYFADITAKDYTSFVGYDSAEVFQALLDQISQVYSENNVDPKKPEEGRVKLLHAAEKLLMEELPIIPVVFNKNATIGTSALKGIKNDKYVAYKFNSAQLKNYEQYLEEFASLYTDFDVVYYNYYNKKK